MKHILALIVKSLMLLVVFSFVLSVFNDYPFWNTVILSLIISVAAYVIGDILILRNANNTISTIADIGLCTLKIWLISPFVYTVGVSFGLAFLTALIVGVGEWFFHKFMVNTVFERNGRLANEH